MNSQICLVEPKQITLQALLLSLYPQLPLPTVPLNGI